MQNKKPLQKEVVVHDSHGRYFPFWIRKYRRTFFFPILIPLTSRQKNKRPTTQGFSHIVMVFNMETFITKPCDQIKVQ